ncbi:MAG: hypothetical protein Athens071412_429 [Parcubacteria group bacterium Athens0714_12]|nr:MAG: hypothetical protein Athens071412_429 [Parcubacteria group bacterium Athens0714_12]
MYENFCNKFIINNKKSGCQMLATARDILKSNENNKRANKKN